MVERTIGFQKICGTTDTHCHASIGYIAYIAEIPIMANCRYNKDHLMFAVQIRQGLICLE